MNSLLLLSALALAPSAPVKEELKAGPLTWKLAKGDKFYTKTTTTTAQTITVMGNDMEQESEQVVFAKYEVLEAGDKGYTIEQTTQKMTSKGNAGTPDYGDKVKGAKLKFVLDKKFEVTKVEGLDDFVDKASGGDEAAKGLLKAMLSEDSVKQNIAEMFTFGPAKDVKVGDSWKKESKFPLGPLGSFKIKNDYKLADGDKVTYKSDATFELSKDEIPGLPFKVSAGELKSDEWSGEIAFDSKAGRLKSTSQKAKLGGSLTISVNGMEIELKLKMNITSDSTLSDKNLADD